MTKPETLREIMDRDGVSDLPHLAAAAFAAAIRAEERGDREAAERWTAEAIRIESAIGTNNKQ